MCVCVTAEWGSAVLVLAQGWGGRCQRTSLDTREEAANSSSSRKSIRPKHKHRRASDSGPALPSPPSLFFPPLCLFLFMLFYCSQLYPLIFVLPRTLQRNQRQLSCRVCCSSLFPSQIHLPLFFSFLSVCRFFCVRFYLPFFFCCCLFVVVAVSVSEAEQSLITGKCSQRKQTPQGGKFAHSVRKTLLSTSSTERDVENGAQVLRQVQKNTAICTETHTHTFQYKCMYLTARNDIYLTLKIIYKKTGSQTVLLINSVGEGPQISARMTLLLLMSLSVAFLPIQCSIIIKGCSPTFFSLIIQGPAERNISFKNILSNKATLWLKLQSFPQPLFKLWKINVHSLKKSYLC